MARNGEKELGTGYLRITKGRKSYTIDPWSELKKTYWIQSSNGEGMEISQEVLFDLVDKYFKEKF